MKYMLIAMLVFCLAGCEDIEKQLIGTYYPSSFGDTGHTMVFQKDKTGNLYMDPLTGVNAYIADHPEMSNEEINSLKAQILERNSKPKIAYFHWNLGKDGEVIVQFDGGTVTQKYYYFEHKLYEQNDKSTKPAWTKRQ